MNEPRIIASQYHERTKHDFRRYARSLGYLDWATQPDPFRRFRDADLVKLELAGVAPQPLYDELYEPLAHPTRPASLETLSSFFEFSLALSAWKQCKGDRWALRINPSSGNLHPTEAYLVVGSIGGLFEKPGVYHYAPKEHGLECRTALASEVWNSVSAGFPEGTFFVGLSSIHWREAWKYGERAYRYCQHDVGHALAALSFAAALHGWSTAPLTELSDASLASLLGLDRESDFKNAEREYPDLLLAVMTGTASSESEFPLTIAHCSLKLVAAGTWFGRANRLSQDHVEWPIIDEVSKACEKPEIPLSRTEPSASAAWQRPTTAGAKSHRRTTNDTCGLGRAPLSARQVLFQRRSAVALDGKTGIPVQEFFNMLDRVLPRFDRAPWHALGPPVHAHLALFVHRVEGLEPGLYFLIRDPQQSAKLRSCMNPQFAWEAPAGCPPGLPFFQLASGDVREIAAALSCHQDIAGDGAFSLGMIVEFDEPLQRYGAWIYRRLFWETGLVGQLLYLEAEAAGLRGTGIGCFFDDPMHRLLGLAKPAYQSLYHFTVGGPVEDNRLTTLPPYPPSQARSVRAVRASEISPE